jgi:hypothetical protein
LNNGKGSLMLFGSDGVARKDYRYLNKLLIPASPTIMRIYARFHACM